MNLILRKNLFISLLLLFVLCIIINCNNKKIKSSNLNIKNNQIIKKPDYPEKYINSINGLVLREKPGVNKKKIDVIPFGEKIKIIKTNNEAVNIGNKSGKWVRIIWGGLTGWVFDGYLSNDEPSKPLLKFEKNLIKNAWYFETEIFKFYKNGTADIHYPDNYYGYMEGEYEPEPIIKTGYWSYDKEMNLFILDYNDSSYFKVLEWDNEKIKLFELKNKYEVQLYKTEEPKYNENYY